MKESAVPFKNKIGHLGWWQALPNQVPKAGRPGAAVKHGLSILIGEPKRKDRHVCVVPSFWHHSWISTVDCCALCRESTWTGSNWWMPCTGGSDLQVCGLVCRAAAAAAPSSSAVQIPNLEVFQFHFCNDSKWHEITIFGKWHWPRLGRTLLWMLLLAHFLD